VLRVLLISTALLGTLAATALAQPPTVLVPGVTYERKLEFTLHGPVRIHIVTTPRPGGLYSLAPTLTAGWLQGRQRLTATQRAFTPDAATVGVNGDLADTRGGPAGLFLRDGVLESPPVPNRSSLGIDPSGRLVVQRVGIDADWQGSGPPRLLKGLNQRPRPGRVTLYTPSWGARTPKSSNTREALLTLFPAARPGTGLTGRVVKLVKGGRHVIPRGGAVLSAKASARARLAAEARPGTVVTVRLLLDGLPGISDAIGGGPLLVERGRPVFDASESFSPSWLVPPKARTAVGQRADGSLVFVVVDGGRPGYSTGLSNFELARTMAAEGAVTAMAFAGGASTAMAFDGELLNRPSSAESPIVDALIFQYDGVQAAPPLETVLSPNGDGFAEQQTLSYKLVRPSTVTATLTGPGGLVHTIDSGERPKTIRRFTWTGLDTEGKLEPEGRWVWKVSALDDLGRRSVATRDFLLDTTLKSLTVQPTTLARRGPLQIDLDLLHPASLTLQVETQRGVPIRTLREGAAPVGHVAMRWSGRVKGRLLAPGRYAIRAIAENEIGRMDLVAPFRSLRRR
jgi:flagellar hook assembly protein FlgD